MEPTQLAAVPLPKTIRSAHPVEKLQLNFAAQQIKSRRACATLGGGGPAFASMLEKEAHILAQVRRPPGLPSSFVALDTALGRSGEIEVTCPIGAAGPEMHAAAAAEESLHRLELVSARLAQ